MGRERDVEEARDTDQWACEHISPVLRSFCLGTEIQI